MNITYITLTALSLLLWAVASEGDFQDALISEADYCARLAQGEHSDYLNISEVCNDRY